MILIYLIQLNFYLNIIYDETCIIESVQIYDEKESKVKFYLPDKGIILHMV